MKNCNSNNYWYGNGTYQKLDEELEMLLPIEGSVKNPKKNKCLENYRKANNAYYDLYNNGGDNRKYHVKKFFGENPHFAETEPVMDKLILDAAYEQGLLTKELA